MELNESKCKVMHLGKKNPLNKYIINRVVLAKTDLEKDLGVWIGSDLKWSHHVDAAVCTANRVWGEIRHSFRYMNNFTFKLLFQSMVRPHLEYGACVWNPFLKKDIQKVEGVQRRATKSVFGLGKLEYDARLNKLNMLSLEERRYRGDMIQQFKFKHGLNIINWHTGDKPSTHTYNTRHHNLLLGEINHSNFRHNFFLNRIVNDWNNMPDVCHKATSINMFKKNYDLFKKTDNS